MDGQDKAITVILAAWVIGALVSLGGIAFVIWVIVKVMQHFGVV